MNKIFDENFKLINTDIIENDEQQLAKEYLHKDDIVLEIGARYGSVSCIISQKTQKSVCVEPDERVWEILEHNKNVSLYGLKEDNLNIFQNHSDSLKNK